MGATFFLALTLLHPAAALRSRYCSTLVCPSVLWAHRSSGPLAVSRGYLRLRGGAKTPAELSQEKQRPSTAKARFWLLLSAAIYGTYPVLLRGLQAVGGEPLPPVFVSCVRYQFLTLFAILLRAYRFVQSCSSPPPMQQAATASVTSSRTDRARMQLWLAASELGAYTVLSSLLSIFGVSHTPAAISEILAATSNLFVPLITLVLLGSRGFGIRTWSGCGLAFLAAVLASIADLPAKVATGSGASGASALVPQGALVLSAIVYSLFRVRSQVHLRSYRAEELNTARMVMMGSLSLLILGVEVAMGGPSSAVLGRLSRVLPAQWALMALSVFLSAFVASSLQYDAPDVTPPTAPTFKLTLARTFSLTLALTFAPRYAALNVLPAANAQPFFALQPLFAALFSWLLLAEGITTGSMVGGGLMMLATVLACTDKTAAKSATK